MSGSGAVSSRGRRIRALLAGGLAPGAGAAVTLAAFADPAVEAGAANPTHVVSRATAVEDCF